MNRRTFLFRLTALSAAAAIPLPLGAAPFAQRIAEPIIFDAPEAAGAIPESARWALYISRQMERRRAV